MSNHDTRYRDLFSHVDMVRALFSGILQACVDDGTLPDVRTFDWNTAPALRNSKIWFKLWEDDCAVLVMQSCADRL